MEGLTGGETSSLTCLRTLFEDSFTRTPAETTSSEKQQPKSSLIRSSKLAKLQKRVQSDADDGRIGGSGDIECEDSSGISRAGKHSRAIWDDSEINVPEKKINDDDTDMRLTPEYDIRYGQCVRSEDVFLGLGGKVNSAQSADHLVVVVTLPLGIEGMQLDTTAHQLDLRSPHYRLLLPFPQEVQENNGSAVWDPAQLKLRITLPVVPSPFVA